MFLESYFPYSAVVLHWKQLKSWCYTGKGEIKAVGWLSPGGAQSAVQQDCEVASRKCGAWVSPSPTWFAIAVVAAPVPTG